LKSPLVATDPNSVQNPYPYQLIGSLSEEEYQALKRDIAKRGVLVPVEMDEDGVTLDGHHRIQAWNELRHEGIKIPDYPRIVRVGMSEAEKRTHARALNILRRQLTSERKRELIAQQLLETPEISDRQIAKSLGVSPTTVGTTRRSLDYDQLSKMDTSLGADGKIYPRRSTSVFAKNAGEAQRAIAAIASADVLPQKFLDVKRVERIAREQRSSPETIPITMTVNDGVDIRCGDFTHVLADIENESVSLILTDPPYSIDHMHLWGKLSDFCDEKLKPGGMLLAYSGQFYLPDVMAALGKHLEYVWTISVVGRGPKTLVHARRIYSKWKPILVYCKPPFKRDAWIDDLFQGEGPEKSEHSWQQALSEALHFVETFSASGDIVVDPFLGSGTNAVACVRLGRAFIGCDIEQIAVQKSIDRIEIEIAEMR